MSTTVLYLPKFLPTSLNKSVGRHWSVKAKQKNGDLEIVQHYAREQRLAMTLHLDAALPARRVNVRMVLPKGQRAFDRDNILKGLLDALVQCGLLVNDSPRWCQIGQIEYVRHDGGLRETFVILEDL
jgi:Holliday junction resolvase RusA-like endonuclease